MMKEGQQLVHDTQRERDAVAAAVAAAREEIATEMRKLTDKAEVSEHKYQAALSELTATKACTGDERSSLFKEGEQLKTEKALLEARVDHLGKEVIELRTTREESLSASMAIYKEEMAKIEAGWQRRYNGEGKGGTKSCPRSAYCRPTA